MAASNKREKTKVHVIFSNGYAKSACCNFNNVQFLINTFVDDLRGSLTCFFLTLPSLKI